MTTLTRLPRPATGGAAPPGRALHPQFPALRPDPPALPPLKSPRALAAWRATINRAALTRAGTATPAVVLYALTRPGGDPHADLATARGYAAAHRLHVADQIVDTIGLHDQACEDDPTLRRGYARALHLLADPSSPVQGVVAVSRTAVTSDGRLYEDQLALHAARGTALHLVRAETDI
ncbi:hypothetical protein ACFWP1_33365 [Streptomyces sp. NPDC058425]|uniref:hypothetical protein n=2 Tax=unclassified Streptomyces TaxID=2593676 RepID=UPI00365281BC